VTNDELAAIEQNYPEAMTEWPGHHGLPARDVRALIAEVRRMRLKNKSLSDLLETTETIHHDCRRQLRGALDEIERLGGDRFVF